MTTVKKLAKELFGEEKEKKIHYTANFDGLCDIVLNGDNVKFLMTDGKVLEEVEIDEKLYHPPTKDDLDYLLPRYQFVLKEYEKHSTDDTSVADDRILEAKSEKSRLKSSSTDVTDVADANLGCPPCRELYNDLLNYHKSISDMPDELYYDLLVWWDFHTYLIENFIYSPILYFFADKERGKTRTAKGLIYLARRGVMTETLREANLIRWGRDHKATLLFDVKNFAKKLDTSQSEDLVYGRAEKGVVASRVLFPEKGAFKDTVRFEVFGPTIVTSNRMIDDIGISRTILMEMKPTEKVFNLEPTPEMALEFKERLTGMRLAHMGEDFEPMDKIETGRLEDMLIGYHRMILTLFPEKENVFFEVKKLLKKQKQEIVLESTEAQILQIILNLEESVEEGTLALSYDSIATAYNEGKKERLQMETRIISRITKAMGFVSKKMSSGRKRGIFYDSKLVNRLKVIYGIEDLEGHPKTSSVTYGSSAEAENEGLNNDSSSATSMSSEEEDLISLADKIFTDDEKK